MKHIHKALTGILTLVLSTSIVVPAEAAIHIGAPVTAAGSVITIHSTPNSGYTVVPTGSSVNVPPVNQSPSPSTTPVVSNPNPVSVPTSVVTIKTGQPSQTGTSVISLKNLLPQNTSGSGSASSTPVTQTTPTTNPTTTPAAPSPSAPAIPSVTALTADEQAMVDMINQERVAAGVSPLKVDLRLASVGRAKANDMKQYNYFDHTSPTFGSPWAMMQQVGLPAHWAGENLAGNKSVPGAMAALMQSPGHRANILDPRFTHVGVGIAYGSAYGNIYVQEFLQE